MVLGQRVVEVVVLQPPITLALANLVETAVAVVVSALPTGANAFLLARRYDTGVGASGATVLLSTLISIATLSVLLAYFKA
jgi:predicted permease